MPTKKLANSRLARFVFTTFILAILLAACAPAPAVELNNTNWKLVAINAQAIPADVTATVQFADGKIGGSGGCNSYGGSYRLEGDKLVFPEPVFSTLMACLDGQMAVEQTLLAALQDGTVVALSGGQLTLTAANGTVLAFAPQ